MSGGSACKAPPYIVAGGRKARPGTEVLKSRGGPAPGSDGPPFQRFFVFNHPSSDTCLYPTPTSKRAFPPHRPLGGSDTRPRCQLVWQWWFSPRPWAFRRRVCDPHLIISARSRARMGSHVGVQTPVYHRGSDPEMVFSARTRARMGSDVGVQTPVPPPGSRSWAPVRRLTCVH